MKRYKFFEDPGHGWLKVSKKELEELGLEQVITSSSYETKNYAYLEEDCDAPTFIKAWEAKNCAKWDYRGNVELKMTNRSSAVRRMKSYSVPKKYRVGVIAKGESEFCFNGLKFCSRETAEVYGRDLMSRWTGAERFEVFEIENDGGK